MAASSTNHGNVDLYEDFFTTYKFSRGPVLGCGMSGDVVLATSLTDPSVRTAVKILSLLTADGGVRNMKLFCQETAVLQRLSHPHIIKLATSAIFPGYVVICTEYCTNGTLTSRLDTLPLALCEKYFLQVACAVRYLNDRQRIVHNDIKPDNIFIDARNDVVLGDFGLSLSFPPGIMIPTKGMGGSRRYNAPEKFGLFLTLSILCLFWQMAASSTNHGNVDLYEDFFTTYKFSRGPVLGCGMSGDVVLATSLTDPSVRTAVKILSLLTADGGVRNMKLFCQETAVLQRLSHPHIIKLATSAIFPGYVVICTEYCTNGTLTSRLDTLPLALCEKYFLQVACAVRYLNDRQRIVHNDIKPDNIFIDARNDVVLGDFGLSLSFPPGIMIPTKEKVYRTMVDASKLDMYSLGVLLWCMLLKREAPCDRLYRCLEDSHLMSGIPEPMCWCLVSTLQLDPDRRHSAATLLKILHGIGFYCNIIDTL
ncbi:unnamed protein product [Candidula unifasciata]|uniref:Protein kinase domain-containing protein n=1 Tax=Candidula unifasciata TaxID=100452 RepID=A0A8S3Z4G8_9EUPU|nr:unnamed protein product [Candidula unifasciata]